MPCNDITEIITLQIDPDDRIINYTLTKETCSGAVGEISLLVELVKSKSSAELLEISASELLVDLIFKNTVEEFLHWKHLVAIQSALATITGEETPDSNQVCIVDEIIYGPEGISFTGLIQIDALTEQIKSCGNGCKGCR